MLLEGTIYLDWEKHPSGYVLREPDPRVRRNTLFKDHRVFVPRVPGEKTERYRIALGKHDVHRELVNSALTEGDDGVLAFVKEWGLLNRRQPPWYAHFLEERERLSRLVRGGPYYKGWTYPWPNLNEPRGISIYASIETHNRRPRMTLATGTLEEFCFFEWLHASTSGLRYVTCGYCSRILPQHKIGRPKVYCSGAHKQSAYRRNNPEVTKAAIDRKRAQRAAPKSAERKTTSRDQ